MLAAITSRGHRMALWLYLLTHKGFLLSDQQEKTLKKSQISPPPRKPWKTKLWRLEPRRLKKKSMTVKELVLWSCFLWSIYIEQRESDGWVGTAAPQWPCRWMKMQMAGGRGEVKAFSDAKHTPEALVQNASASAHQGRSPPPTQPTARITSRPSTFSSRQTLDSFCRAEPTTRDRCALLRESSLISCRSANY